MRVKATGSFIINTMYRGDEKNRNGMVSPVGGKNQCRTTAETMRSFGMVKLARSAYHAKIWVNERSKAE